MFMSLGMIIETEIGRHLVYLQILWTQMRFRLMLPRTILASVFCAPPLIVDYSLTMESYSCILPRKPQKREFFPSHSLFIRLRDTLFGISIHDTIWDVLHAKIRIGNKILRLLYDNIPPSKQGEPDKEAMLTKLVREVHSQFNAYHKTVRNKATVTNLQGMGQLNVAACRSHICRGCSRQALWSLP